MGLLGLLPVSTCCCCSLKAGGLIIGYIYLIILMGCLTCALDQYRRYTTYGNDYRSESSCDKFFKFFVGDIFKNNSDDSIIWIVIITSRKFFSIK